MPLSLLVAFIAMGGPIFDELLLFLSCCPRGFDLEVEQLYNRVEGVRVKNKIMFWIGIAIIVTISILMLTVKEDISLGVIGIIGILFIGASQYRPLKK